MATLESKTTNKISVKFKFCNEKFSRFEETREDRRKGGSEKAIGFSSLHPICNARFSND